jgi:hypothetical protein
MSKEFLSKITNNFQSVRLISLAKWRQAGEISPRDRSGPYVVIQEGYDPADVTMSADEFVLGRSGRWMSLGHFFKMPVAERRDEFVFGTAAEVMMAMQDLPSNPVVMRPGGDKADEEAAPADDDMAAAFEAGKEQSAPGDKKP